MGSRTQVALFCGAASIVSWVLHFSSDKFPDPDVFYHFRHAAIYGSSGIIQTAFPWVHYSIISKFASNLWYGFQFLIIPFTWFEDPLLGMRWAGVFVTFTFLVLFFGTSLLLDLKPAFAWPFFLLFPSAFLLHRLTMLRPQALSLGLSGLLFALLVKRKVWVVFAAATASTFFHLNFFFVSFLVFGVVASSKLIFERVVLWREGIGLGAGVLPGWLLRPNPLGAAKILYFQLVQLNLEKAAGRPLAFAAEMSPMVFKLTSNYLLFDLLLAAALFYLAWNWVSRRAAIPNDDRATLGAGAVLAVIFFALSAFYARRAFDFCSGFGVILIALVFSRMLFDNWAVRIALIGAALFLVPYGFNLRQKVLAVGWDGRRFEGAAQWITENSRPGEIVFNARWNIFPSCFSGIAKILTPTEWTRYLNTATIPSCIGWELLLLRGECPSTHVPGRDARGWN